MEKRTFIQKLEAMPFAILPTMVGVMTLSNIYLSAVGYTWIRHLSVWAAAFIALVFIIRIFTQFDAVKKEYSNAIPASLYSGLTMILMIFGSYIFTYNASIGKGIWFLGVIVHTLHIVVFTYRFVIRRFNFDHFTPTWFVTYNGLLVATVVGVPMNEPVIGTLIAYYGIIVYCIIIPFMVLRLSKRPLPNPLAPAKVILLAPCSLCLVSYLNFIATPNPIIVYALYIAVIITLIFIAINIPKILSSAFHPGFAGITFPMAIGTVASSRMPTFFASQNQETFALIATELTGIQLYVTTALIGFVAYNFMKLFVSSYRPSQPQR